LIQFAQTNKQTIENQNILLDIAGYK